METASRVTKWAQTLWKSLHVICKYGPKELSGLFVFFAFCFLLDSFLVSFSNKLNVKNARCKYAGFNPLTTTFFLSLLSIKTPLTNFCWKPRAAGPELYYYDYGCWLYTYIATYLKETWWVSPASGRLDNSVKNF